MNKYSSNSRFLPWLMAVALAGVMAGCGGGGGGGGTTTTAVPIIPGAACTAVGVLIPRVTSSNPSDGNLNVSISTAGVVNSGKQITATFSMAMNPATLNSDPAGTLPTFTLKNNTAGGSNVTGTVAMNASGTTATFTTTAVGSAALVPGNSYTATITTFAKSAAITNDALGCAVAWTFTAGAAAAGAGQANVDLGTAGTYGIFASADADITVAVDALIVGDVGLMNGAGLCPNCAPVTVTGTTHNGDAAAIQAQIDISAAFNDASTRSTGLCTLGAFTEIGDPQGQCVNDTSQSIPGGGTPGSGGIYRPGLYWSGSTIDLGVSRTITLDAQNDPDAVFIFQATSAITTLGGTEVILLNQAQAKNVFWVAGTAATIGVSSKFKGTVISNTEAITVHNGTGGIVGVPTLVEGRMFSRGAAITVEEFATVTVPE